MKQNVNLYQPAARPLGSGLDARRIAAGWAVAVAVVLAAQFWLERRNADLDVEVARLQEVAGQRGIELGELTAATMAATDPALAARLAEVLRELDLRETVLGVVSGASAGDVRGFSGELRALARQRVQGVWLTHVDIRAPGGRTALAGRALSPAAVPLYLRQLSDEAGLSGQRFDAFAIERPAQDGEPVLFSLQRRGDEEGVRFARD